MARVTGIGGFFFRATDPDALVEWYETHLGVAKPPIQDGDPYWWQQAGPTVWSPMPAEDVDTGRADRGWMLSFRVDDLDGMLAHFAEEGIEVERGVEEYEYGRFAWLRDPERNPLELWEPAEPRMREP